MLSPALFQRAWARGQRLTQDEAVTMALDEAVRISTGASVVVDPDASISGLSAREQEVIRLVAAGCSDSEIADQLYISKRTVTTHVGHILTKLNLTNRAEAAAWAVRHELA